MASSTTLLPFSGASRELVSGKKIARQSWPQGTFIQNANPDAPPRSLNSPKYHGKYILHHSADGTEIVGWFFSGADYQAKDYIIVE